MSKSRRLLLSWAEQRHVALSDLSRALAFADVLPSPQGWRRFLDRLFLWMGTLLVASGVIFFLAYNWKDLGRFAKFSLVEVLLVAALLFVWRLGLERPGGKASLFAASLFLGALLALIGQTYQTGADTFELFGAWAALILPWVAVGRFTALWLLWLLLVDLAITLYFHAFPSVLGLLVTMERVLWVLFGVNTVAFTIWEAVWRVKGLDQRWGPRLLATASGSLITALAMWQILDAHNANAWAIPVWLAWLAAAWTVYRRLIKDVFVLAGGALSVIVVAATFFGKHLADGDPAGFLLVGLIVIGLSAAAARWLKRLAMEDEQ